MGWIISGLSVLDFVSDISDRIRRLSMCIIDSYSNTSMDDIHQTLCAKNRYQLMLAKDKIISRAYTMMSLLLSKDISIS
jgi:hypothetical protein